MTADKAAAVRDLAAFLERDLDAKTVENICRRASLSSMRSAAVASAPEILKEAASKFYRGGRVGDWRDYIIGADLLDRWNEFVADGVRRTGENRPTERNFHPQ